MSDYPYTFDLEDADLILQPSPSPVPRRTADASQMTEFRVHRFVLSAASTVFSGMFDVPQPTETKESSLPVIPLSEPAHILHLFLQHLYPIPKPPIHDLSTLSRILEPAVKYDAECVIERLREILVSPRFLETEPMRVYAIACRWEFEEEAKIASTHTLSLCIPDIALFPDLKSMNAYDHHRLLTFHKTRAQSAMVLVDGEPMVGNRTCQNPANFFYEEYRKKAKEELQRRPTTKVISSVDFILEIMSNGSNTFCNCSQPTCQRNANSYRTFVAVLCTKINALPSTV